MNKPYFAIQKAENAADIYIFGDITPWEYFDSDISANGIINQIKDLTVPQINVYIDSYGGAVSEGWAIYEALTAHPAKVCTYGMGFVASAALFPFLAGDERYAGTLSAYYLHQVQIGVQGYAGELRAAADEAEAMTDIGINAFVQRAGMDADKVRELMAAETWLTPEQALDYGIATAKTADIPGKYTQSVKRDIISKLFPAPSEDKPKLTLFQMLGKVIED